MVIVFFFVFSGPAGVRPIDPAGIRFIGPDGRLEGSNKMPFAVYLTHCQFFSQIIDNQLASYLVTLLTFALGFMANTLPLQPI
jgi:hypothetical protein